MKKFIFLLLLGVLLLSLTGCAHWSYADNPIVELIDYDEENIHLLFDVDWIVGKSYNEVTRRYGDFNSEFEEKDGTLRCTYYVNWKNTSFFGLGPSNLHDDFRIIFNEDGIAIDAYFQRGAS